MEITFLFLFLFLFSLHFESQGKISFWSDYTHNETCPYANLNISNSCIDYQESSLTNLEKDYLIDGHNNLRESLSSGANEKLPKAIDMKKISWNQDLAKIAQSWAKQCKSTKEPFLPRKNRAFGQNIAIGEGNSKVEDLMKIWVDQLDHLSPEIVGSYAEPKEKSRNFESVTQMIWANTTQMGCGKSVYSLAKRSGKKSENKTGSKIVELVCSYFPAGNQLGRPVYTTRSTDSVLYRDEKSKSPRNTSLQNDIKPKTSFEDHALRESRIMSKMIELSPALSKTYFLFESRVNHFIFSLLSTTYVHFCN